MKKLGLILIVLILSYLVSGPSAEAAEKSVSLSPSACTLWRDAVEYGDTLYLDFKVPSNVRKIKRFELQTSISKDAYCLLWIFPGKSAFRYVPIYNSGSYTLTEIDWDTRISSFYPRLSCRDRDKFSFMLQIRRRPPLQKMRGSFAMLNSARLVLHYE